MSYFAPSTPHTEASTNCFYNAIPEESTGTSLSNLFGNNREWIWLLLIVFLFLNCRDLLGSSDGNSYNMLILIILAFFFFTNTTSTK